MFNMRQGFGYNWSHYIAHVLEFYAEYMLHKNPEELGRGVAEDIMTSNNICHEDGESSNPRRYD
jgi:hypothetical protein